MRRPIILVSIGFLLAAGNVGLAADNDTGDVLGRFKDRLGFERIFVQLPPGTGSKDLIAIGSAWHVREPEGWFWFLDDGEKAQQMLAAMPEAEKGDLSNYPGAWVASHSLGHIQMELLPGGGRRWTLMPGAERVGEPLAVLEANQ